MIRSKIVIALWLYCSTARAEDNVTAIQRTETKAVENRFPYWPIDIWLQCLQMVRETRVQSQFESCQRPKKKKNAT